MTDFETLKATLKEEILKELSSKTEGHELKATKKTRKSKKTEKDDTGATDTHTQCALWPTKVGRRALFRLCFCVFGASILRNLCF